MARPTMESLITRLRALLNGDAQLTDDDLQVLLDDQALVVDALLIPRTPFWREHVAPYDNLEASATVYVGYDTALTKGVDYTIDLQRGIVTTPVAERRGLKLLGYAYDLNAAAAAGWERIAARYVGAFDFSTTLGGSYQRAQQHAQALTQAQRYRALAWPRVATVDRADTPGHGADTADRLLDGWRKALV